jgi:hypothetical protein
MGHTLILYDGKYGHSEKTAEVLHGILENSDCCPADMAPQNLEGVKNLILVFGFLAYDTARHLKPYLKAHQEELKEKMIGIVGVGLAKIALPPFLRIIEEPMERKADDSWFVMGGYKVADLTPADKEMLIQFWAEKGQALKDQEGYKESEVKKVGTQIKALLSR